VSILILLMLRTCGSTSAEVKEVCNCASTVAVKDVHTYNVVAVLIMFVTMCLLLMSRVYLYRYTRCVQKVRALSSPKIQIKLFWNGDVVTLEVLSP